MEFPVYEFREKVAEALVHSIRVLAAVIGVTILIVMTALNGDDDAMIAGAVLGVGLLASFTSSAAHNNVELPDWRAVLKRADHAGVYLLIAGAYTPIAAVFIGDQVGWSVLAFVWVTAIAAIILNVALPERFNRAPIVLYLMIGWALIGASDSAVSAMSREGLSYIIYCAVALSTGLIFARWDALPFQNAIWHVFVLGAISFLYAAIFVELTAR